MQHAEFQRESLRWRLREANYWSREGKQLRSARLLGRMVLDSPLSLFSRTMAGEIALLRSLEGKSEFGNCPRAYRARAGL